MVELDEATRRALLAREGPPASARADILAGLRARLGGSEGPDDPGDPGDRDPSDPSGNLRDRDGPPSGFEAADTAGGQLAWAAKIAGATLGLTAAGLLTVKLAADVLRPSGTTNDPASAVVESAAPPTVASASPEAVEGPESLPSSPSSTAAVPPKPTAAEAGAVEASEPSDTSESTLAAELELVRAAKQLRRDHPEAALAKLDQHRERFPDGSLAPERDALRVQLLCALGREREALRARAQFLDEHADSPLRARVNTKCGTDSAGTGD